MPVQPDLEWCVTGLLVCGGGTILAGQPGVSKTIHAVWLATCVALGVDFGQFHVPRARNVLYLDYDSSYAQMRLLFEAVSRAMGYQGIPDNIHFHFPGDPNCLFEDGSSPPMALGDLGEYIAATVEKYDIGLVIVDSLMQAMTGDPSSAPDAKTALRQGLSPAMHRNVAVLAIDHTTKAMIGHPTVPTPFGSQAKRAWYRFSAILEAEEVNGKERIRWSVDKSNFRKFPAFWTEIDFQDDNGQLSEVTVRFIGNATSRTAQNIQNSSDTAAKKEILRLLTQSSQLERKRIPKGGTYDRALKTLVETNEIIKIRHGVYALSRVPDTEHVDHTTTPDPPE